jgi:hypothetical protein
MRRKKKEKRSLGEVLKDLFTFNFKCQVVGHEFKRPHGEATLMVCKRFNCVAKENRPKRIYRKRQPELPIGPFSNESQEQ